MLADCETEAVTAAKTCGRIFTQQQHLESRAKSAKQAQTKRASANVDGKRHDTRHIQGRCLLSSTSCSMPDARAGSAPCAPVCVCCLLCVTDQPACAPCLFAMFCSHKVCGVYDKTNNIVERKPSSATHAAHSERPRRPRRSGRPKRSRRLRVRVLVRVQMERLESNGAVAAEAICAARGHLCA